MILLIFTNIVVIHKERRKHMYADYHKLELAMARSGITRAELARMSQTNPATVGRAFREQYITPALFGRMLPAPWSGKGEAAQS